MILIKTTLICLIVLELAISVVFGQSSQLTNEYYQSFNAGRKKESKNDYDGAIIEYTKSINAKPDFLVAYAGRAWMKCMKRDYNGAIVDYSKMIELQPSLFDTYIFRAIAKEKKGDHDGAIADCTLVIVHEKKPTVLLQGAYYNRGFSKKNKGDLEGAMADFQKTLEIKSDKNITDDAQKELDAIKKLLKK